MDENLKEETLIFLDVETTGLFPEKERICEIAMLEVRDFKIERSFSTLINPQKRIDYGAYMVNRIEEEDLEKAPIFEEVADQIIDFIGERTLIGYNIGFDISFINEELKRINYTLLQNKAIDILLMVKDFFPQLDRYSLVRVCNYLNIYHNFHRAMEDVLASYEVFTYIYKDMNSPYKDTTNLYLRYRIK